MTVLSLRYELVKTVKQSRSTLMMGSPSVRTDDTSYQELTFDTNEEHTLEGKNCLYIEFGQPLDVELTLYQPDGSSVVTRQDLGGMLVLPCKSKAVVRCPARFGYSLGITVRAVTG